MISLDAKDKKILSELDMDARQSISSIAKKVGLSKEVVNYRIKQLEKKGLITGYYTVLNVSQLGFRFCRFLMRFQNVDMKKETEIVNFAKTFPEVCWMINLRGNWDMVFVILVSNIIDLKKITDKISYKYGSSFQRRHISIATKVHHMKHNYLYGKKDDTSVVLGGRLVRGEIDATDQKILNILSRDARISTLEIARRLDLTPNTVKYRIKKLLEKGIILCFRAAIDIKKLGYQRHKVIFTLQNMEESRIMQMMEMLRQNPSVVYITESVGLGDIEFEIDVKDSNELHEQINRIRKEFGNMIKEYELLYQYAQEEINYLPLDLSNIAATKSAQASRK
ncbi:Lrp/AsnC family transcriptional regulator [Candidatus Woesearchaeota archaeon]|nr:Lrp/AsnC family transcriptional regulator [Candidatus Woesearchaeota archaeon]